MGNQQLPDKDVLTRWRTLSEGLHRGPAWHKFWSSRGGTTTDSTRKLRDTLIKMRTEDAERERRSMFAAKVTACTVAHFMFSCRIATHSLSALAPCSRMWRPVVRQGTDRHMRWLRAGVVLPASDDISAKAVHRHRAQPMV